MTVPAQQPNQTLSDAMNQRLADDLDCLVIGIDAHDTVLKWHGDTTYFLLHKNFTLNLTELLPRPVAVAFENLKHIASQTGQQTTVKGVRFRLENTVKVIKLSVSPLAPKKGHPGAFMITFSKDETTPAPAEETAFDEKIFFDQYTRNLEEEIKALKNKLQAAYEKLDNTSESLQSYNEELISANEEMHSTNEEMFSMNEQLTVLNADYQLKNKALQQLQLELDEKNKSLLRVNADLDHFVHAASHDLLAPLGNIETSIELMTEIAASDPNLTDFLEIIHSSVKTFRSLVTEIGAIAKVEGDMLYMEPVDVGELVDNIRWSLEDKITGSNAVIITRLEVSHIHFSKKNLRSILFNLVSNGIKFTRGETPVIHIGTFRESDHIVLTVQDNGMGISAYSTDKIFEMYGRLNQEAEGQGIGLYLAKKIVNAADGQILVESQPGQGSKFSIHFKSGPK